MVCAEAAQIRQNQLLSAAPRPAARFDAAAFALKLALLAILLGVFYLVMRLRYGLSDPLQMLAWLWDALARLTRIF